MTILANWVYALPIWQVVWISLLSEEKTLIKKNSKITCYCNMMHVTYSEIQSMSSLENKQGCVVVL